MLTTLALCLLTSLPVQDVAAGVAEHMVAQMNDTPWPWGFHAPMYDPVWIEAGAITSAEGGYMKDEIYIQIPTLLFINAAAPKPFHNKHIHCSSLSGDWICDEQTSWARAYDPEVWKAFDISVAEMTASILNEG